MLSGRHAVWILGSASTLCGHSKLWRNLVDDAKQVNCFFKATQVEWMSDVINIFKRHGSSSLQQGDGDERDMGTDRTINFCAQSSMAASPSGRSWEYEEPPQVCLLVTFSNSLSRCDKWSRLRYKSMLQLKQIIFKYWGSLCNL